MFCPKCGGELKQENGFDYVCEKCGASYSFKEKTPEPAAPKVNDSIYGDLTPETMAEDSKTSSDESYATPAASASPMRERFAPAARDYTPARGRVCDVN